MPSYPLTNFEIKKNYQSERKFNGVYSRDNLPKLSSTERNYVERSSSEIKDEAYIINLDEYSDIRTRCWNDVTYFGSFGVEYIPKEMKKIISNVNIKNNIFRTQAYDSIICGYFCIGFFDFMLAGKTLTNFTNIFSPNKF